MCHALRYVLCGAQQMDIASGNCMHKGDSRHPPFRERTMSFSMASMSSSNRGFALCRRVATRHGVSPMNRGEPQRCRTRLIRLCIQAGHQGLRLVRAAGRQVADGGHLELLQASGAQCTVETGTHRRGSATAPGRVASSVPGELGGASLRTHCLMLCVVSTVALGKLMRFTYAYVFSNTLRSRTQGSTVSIRTGNGAGARACGRDALCPRCACRLPLACVCGQLAVQHQLHLGDHHALGLLLVSQEVWQGRRREGGDQFTLLRKAGRPKAPLAT